jgi:hypothetical protein
VSAVIARGLTAGMLLALAGCSTTEVVREVQVPVKIPSLCTTECAISKEASLDTQPPTNGALADAWKERGTVIECYRDRMQCVIEMQQGTDKKDERSESPSKDESSGKKWWNW